MRKLSRYFLPLIILIGLVLITTACSPGTNIAKAVAENYSLKDSSGKIKTYESSDDVTNTVNRLVKLKRPYDQKAETGGKSILLYDEAVLIIEEHMGKTEIELIEDHETAYNRHRSTMILFWGGNVFSRGRINTPRSIRRGSIGSSSSKGGGFSFGK